ncbi:MAG TPA: efflux RND transporter periplasmic adaptor subunit [Candidatus Acidoferrales bacterium]|nr:efflux RND transporter periplasmic adaptor subunit [Candidatus Acidoferrales bacterium]
MNRKKHAITVLSMLMIGLIATLAGCTNERSPAAAPPETLSNVSVIAVQKTAVPDWLEAVGTVRAAQTSQVSSQMMGNIVEIRTHEGDRVQQGQVLAIIDDAQPRSVVNQATAAVAASEQEVAAADSDFALADATLKRYQQLYEKKSVSPQEFDEIKARYQSAEARRNMVRAGQAQANAALMQARTLLGYTNIRAPFAGVVTQKMADAGTLASPSMPIFTIEDTRSYRLEVTVNESDIRLVHAGQTAPVSIDALGNAQLIGKVVQIVPAADPSSRSFLVKVGLPSDARLRSGLFGRAEFSRGQRESLLIPRASVVERGQLQGVYVLDANQIAELRYVTLGNSTGGQIEVLSGLQDGEKLVAAPGDRDLGGKRIATRP